MKIPLLSLFHQLPEIEIGKRLKTLISTIHSLGRWIITPLLLIYLFILDMIDDDEIYSKEEERLKVNAIFMKFQIVWIEFEPDPGNVVAVWNGLMKVALSHKFNWFKILGDDIRLPNDPSWLRVLQKGIVKNNYVGWGAGYSNNDNIATQFLIHRTHWEIFEFVFPPQLKNFFCDDFLNEVYPQKYKIWRKDYPLLNTGGHPRYIPRNDRKLCDMLVRRHKKEIPEFLNMVSKIKK
jgi:hypothetical protein